MSQYFNPRSPRGGATKIDLTGYVTINSLFQSTLPTRGSDCISCCLACCIAISIHAPHEGERRCVCMVCVHVVDFNPRSPRGGATNAPNRGYARVAISIHAPHEGERLCAVCRWLRQRDFNPRSPRGGATLTLQGRAHAHDISIHAPHEGERR